MAVEFTRDSRSAGKAVVAVDRGIEGLRLVDLPPLPAPGPNQIVLRMSAACLNHRDEFGIMGGRGFIPCSDGVGRVKAVGSSVTRVKVGDRVCPIFHQNWLQQGPMPSTAYAVGNTKGIPGTLCEEMLLSEENVVKVPEHLTDAEAATLPCAGVTAWSGIVTEGRMKAGETVLVEGTGGVSIFGLQFAKALGGKVICTSSSNEKLEKAKGLGADQVINYKETPEWGKAAKKMGGADHVIDIGGGGTLKEALASLNEHGSLAVIGLLSGVKADLNVVQFFAKRIRMNGIAVGSREDFEAMNALIDKAKLRPVVDREFPLADARGAFELMHSGNFMGNIVVKIGGGSSKL